MAIPSPFNTVEALMGFTSFRQGAGGPSDEGATLRQAAEDGTFAVSQFEDALQKSRNEIYARCGRKPNADYTDWRLSQLTEAELWLATARLYPKYGERIAIKFSESNLAGVESVTLGADTPPPSGPGSKGEFYTKFMVQQFRGFGLQLMLGMGENWSAELTTAKITNEPFPCLLPGYTE